MSSHSEEIIMDNTYDPSIAQFYADMDEKTNTNGPAYEQPILDTHKTPYTNTDNADSVWMREDCDESEDEVPFA
jgi:hypothetical protein